MKKITRIGAALVAALAAASTIAWSGPGGGADPQWEFDSVISDGFAAYVPCLEENVLFYGEAPYRRHTVTAPSDNTSYKVQFLPQTPNLLPFIAVGEQSGTVYYYANGHPYNESFHAGAGETHSFHAHDLFISDEGVKLRGKFVVHTTVNANGRLVVDRFELDVLDCE